MSHIGKRVKPLIASPAREQSEILEKEKNLINHVKLFESCVVAYSGGVDSSLVASVAHRVLGQKSLMVLANSPSLPRSEMFLAKGLAKQKNWNLLVIETDEMQDERYQKNDSFRCFHCKTEFYGKLDIAKREWGADVMFDGSNFDDQKDFRPGRTAAINHKVVSPLFLANLTKSEVRVLARKYDLPNFDKPASPCLSSRLPHGERVTHEKLHKVELAEKYLKKSFAREDLRVRYFGKKARIDIEKIISSDAAS